MAEGKTYEETMDSIMATIPPSSSPSEEAGELGPEPEDEFVEAFANDCRRAVMLFENASMDVSTDAHSHEVSENGEEQTAPEAAVGGSNETKSECPCCGGPSKAFQTEYAISKFMQKAKSILGHGSTEYFDAVAPLYNYSPSQVARGNFLKGLIKNLKEQGWIVFDADRGRAFKALDYAAGTGFLSHALAPYVTEVLAVDKSSKMVEEYNKIVAEENKTKCEMKAVQGDLTTHFLVGKEVGMETPNGVFAGFDMVAMCLAVDSFCHDDADEDTKRGEFLKSLSIIINLINPNGTLLILDIEKCRQDCYQDADSHSPGSSHEGLKITGSGSTEVAKALKELGMKDTAVTGEQAFVFEVEEGDIVLRRTETYFVVKAKRGPLFKATVSDI